MNNVIKEIRRKKAKDFISKMISNKMGLAGIVILVVFIAMALLGPILYPFDIQKIGEVNAIMKPPSFEHLLGTDELGRDILGYLISGSRVSMMVGLLATFISMLIGTVLGIISGYYDKTAGVIIMRITDFFLVIPWLPLMIVLASIMGTSIWNIIIVIGITSWAGTARVVRSQTLSVKELQFIERARAIGSSDSHIMKKHILPNVFPLVIANTVLNAAVAITTETTLSFLGLGDATRPSWGVMLHYAFESGAMSVGAYWYFLPPGICIILVVLAFTFLGFAFDDIVNPKLKRR
ncbi:MAG: ABC transporter permease [Sedimentibacter sp.]